MLIYDFELLEKGAMIVFETHEHRADTGEALFSVNDAWIVKCGDSIIRVVNRDENYLCHFERR